MYNNVKVGDNFALKANGANYQVYNVLGRGKNYIPDAGETVIYLKLTSRTFFSLGSNALLSVPEVDLHLFFDKDTSKV